MARQICLHWHLPPSAIIANLSRAVSIIVEGGGGVDVICQLDAANQPQLVVCPNAWCGGRCLTSTGVEPRCFFHWASALPRIFLGVSTAVTRCSFGRSEGIWSGFCEAGEAVISMPKLHEKASNFSKGDQQ